MITVWGSAVQMKILSRLAMLGSHFGIVMSAMGKRLFQAIEDWDALELIIGDDQERKHHLKMKTT